MTLVLGVVTAFVQKREIDRGREERMRFLTMTLAPLAADIGDATDLAAIQEQIVNGSDAIVMADAQRRIWSINHDLLADVHRPDAAPGPVDADHERDQRRYHRRIGSTRRRSRSRRSRCSVSAASLTVRSPSPSPSKSTA